jgi:hypothetical protein
MQRHRRCRRRSAGSAPGRRCSPRDSRSGTRRRPTSRTRRTCRDPSPRCRPSRRDRSGCRSRRVSPDGLSAAGDRVGGLAATDAEADVDDAFDVVGGAIRREADQRIFRRRRGDRASASTAAPSPLASAVRAAARALCSRRSISSSTARSTSASRCSSLVGFLVGSSPFEQQPREHARRALRADRARAELPFDLVDDGCLPNARALRGGEQDFAQLRAELIGHRDVAHASGQGGRAVAGERRRPGA